MESIDRSGALGPVGLLGEEDHHAGIDAAELSDFLEEVREFLRALERSLPAAICEGIDGPAVSEAVSCAHSIKSLVSFARMDDLVQLCHILEESLQEVGQCTGDLRDELAGMVRRAVEVLNIAFDECQRHGGAVTVREAAELARSLEDAVHGFRIGDGGGQFRIDMTRSLRHALTPVAESALLAAMIAGEQVVEFERYTPGLPAGVRHVPLGLVLAEVSHPDDGGRRMLLVVLEPGAEMETLELDPATICARVLHYVRRMEPGLDPEVIRLSISPEDEKSFRRAADEGLGVHVVGVAFGADDPVREGRSRYVFEALRERCRILLSAPPLERLAAGECHGAFRAVIAAHEDSDSLVDLLDEIADGSEHSARPFVFSASESRPKRARQGEVREALQESHACVTELLSLLSTQDLPPPIGAATERLKWAIQRGLASADSVPAADLVRGVAQLVRTIARRRRRSAVLRTEIGVARLPRSLVQALRDPLVHVVRNSVDHGIESPEERKALDKETRGEVLIRMDRQADDWVVEVVDDGAGIRAEQIRAKFERMPGMAIEELIFLPGITETDRVDEISGRGLGMGIARDAVARLGGEVTAETWPGRGTLVRFRVPHGGLLDAWADGNAE